MDVLGMPAGGTLIFLEGGLRGTLIKRVERIWDGFFLGDGGAAKAERDGNGFFWRVCLICGVFFVGEDNF